MSFEKNFFVKITKKNIKKKITSLFSSQRKCLFNDESFPFEELRNASKTNFYNQDYCHHYCQANEFVKKCQCLPHIFDKIFYSSMYNLTYNFFLISFR